MPQPAPKPPAKPLESYKRDAARLLKAARSGDTAARQRLAVLDNPPDEPQLKHALAVIAREAGQSGWAALKQAQTVDFSEIFASPGLSDSLNHWFATYEDAKQHQSDHGGILLPYRHQCFVTSTEILPRLGYERDDPDWRDIGYDFVRPASPAAYDRIKARLTRRLAKP